MATVRLIHDYACDPDKLFAMAVDFDVLMEVMEGLMTYEGMPSEGPFEGQKVHVKTRLFGTLPPQDYFMEVVEYDPARRIIRSREHGAGAKRWDHTLTVEEIPGGARLDDLVEVEAGWKTPIYTAFCRYVYRKRDAPRRRALGLTAA